MWIVYLTGDAENRRLCGHTFGDHYFPRQYHYKKEALLMVRSLKDKGIHATCKSYSEYREMVLGLENIDQNLG